MVILLVLLLIVQCTTSNLHGSHVSPNRFSLRKLLQENVGYYGNSTNATTPTSTSSVQGYSMGILQVVGEQGSVRTQVSTDQNIRLRVKALTTPGLIGLDRNSCQIQFLLPPTNYDLSSLSKCLQGFASVAQIQNLENLFDKCASEEVALIKTHLIPFEENGVLEAHTDLFTLMPLYDEEFTFLRIHCEVTLCHLNTDCYVTCSERQSKWRMDKEARNIELSTVIEVKKERPTPKPQVIEEKQDLKDFLISGGRQPPPPRPVPYTEAPFLKKNQQYFTVSTLGVCVLLLMCVICIGCMFISYKNNKECDEIPREQSPSSLPGYYDNKMTGLQNVLRSSQNEVFNSRVQETSPPPEYKSASAWPGAEFNPRSPYRDAGVLTPSEAAVLEARRLLRNNQSSPRIQKPVQRRLALEAGPRGLYGNDHEAGRAQRNQHPTWNEAPEQFREPVGVPTSPVGGEWYPVPNSRGRSPQSEPLIQKSPLRGQGKTTSLINMALKEYFEKYGM